MSTGNNNRLWIWGTIIAFIGTAAAVLTVPEARKFLNLEESETPGLETLSGQYSGAVTYDGATTRDPMLIDIDVKESGKVSGIFKGSQGDLPLNGETDGNRIWFVVGPMSMNTRGHLVTAEFLIDGKIYPDTIEGKWRVRNFELEGPITLTSEMKNEFQLELNSMTERSHFRVSK